MSMRVDNTVIITGNLVRDPEPFFTSNNQPRCRYQVAITPRKKDGNGTFMPYVIAKGVIAEQNLQNLKKGSLVTIGGRIQTYEMDMKFYLIEDKDDPTQLIELTQEAYEEITDPEILKNVKFFSKRIIMTSILAEDVRYYDNK